MWHADATHDTLLTTGNGGREPTRAQATLFYNGGESRYRVEKLLRPGEQIWLDLAKLIRNQIPDSDGHVLPSELMTGSYELRDLDHPLVGEIYEGKLVVDKTYGHAAYGCAGCCGYVSAAFGVDPFGGPPDIDFGETVQAWNACSSRFDDVTGSVYGWASSDTKVATLPNSTLHTVAVGSATGSGTVDLQSDNIRSNCPPIPRTPEQVINVCPTSSSISSTTPESLAKVFPTYKTGLGSDVAVLVSPATPNGTIVTETLSQGSRTCPTNWPNLCTTSTGATSSSLVVGTAGKAFDGTTLPATPNVMWDYHIVASASSLLGSSGQQCSAQCSQQYTCGGAVIGQYTITYTFKTGTINGTAVTNVTATVQ